jgi:glycosyltransferase involved in cell wall biosynthesis
MNILEVNKFYYARRGAERHFLDVIRLFESLEHKVAVFAMQHPKNLPSSWDRFFVSYVGYNTDDATRWQRILGSLRLFWSCEARRKARALVQEFHPDVVHLHNIYHQLSPSILAPLKESGAKLVMTVHDYAVISPDKDAYYTEVGQEYWRFLLMKKYGFVKRALLVLKMYWERWWDFYSQVDVFLAPSEVVHEALIAGGIAPKKIVVIPHFIAGERENMTDFPKVSQPFALYCGSLSKEKGVEELAMMFDDLRILLVLAGSVEQRFVLPKSPWVKAVGQQSKEALAQMMKEASCVVSGSPLPETFGLIALEAGSFGKPFFGLKSGAYKEVVSCGVNGFLAEDFKGLSRALAAFFSGGMPFDSNVVQEYAFKNYGKEKYARDFFEKVA